MQNQYYLQWIEIMGTLAFAISGASQAILKKFDYFGVLIIAYATSIGGGTLRDVLIGDLPVAWMRDERTLLIIFMAALVTIVVRGLHRKLTKTLFVFDSLGLGLFTLVGLQKGLEAGFSPGISVALGTMTGCFGGVIRDVLLNNVPLIFHREIYASASLAGGLLFLLLKYMGVTNHWSEIASIILIVGIRVIAVRYRLMLPSVSQWPKRLF